MRGSASGQRRTANCPASRGVHALQGSDPFLGGFLNAVDAKGRVSLPAGFRKILANRVRGAEPVAADEGGSLYLGEDNRLDCVRAFDAPYARLLDAAVSEEVAALGLGPLDRMDEEAQRSADAFAGVVPVAYDGVGRMVIPAHLRASKGIADLAWFFGTSTMIQIWSPARFEAAHAGKPKLLDPLRAALAERAK